MAKTSSRLADKGAQTSWDRARLSIVVPISVIVAVAIVCIVVAVLTSARRADEVALEHEKRLFSRALVNHGERILRELESVATTEEALRRIRDQFDRDWVHNRIGLWLKNYFDHDFVFVADGSDRLTYALLGRNSVEPTLVQFDRAGTGADARLHARPLRRATEPGGAHLRAAPRRAKPNSATAPCWCSASSDAPPRSPRSWSPRPISSQTPSARAAVPIVVTVKFIDEEVLADIAARVQLQNLHMTDAASAASAIGTCLSS